MLTTEQRRARSRLANATARANRNGLNPACDIDVADARRQYRFVTAQEYVRRLVDAAPPLTADQRDRLALLLRGAAADTDKAPAA